MRALLAAVFALLFTLPVSAQGDAWPQAAPEDVASIEAIVAAVYEVISGPATEERDWNRFRSLFHPEGRLVPLAPTPEGGWRPLVWSVEDYVERAGPMFRDAPMFQGKGFYEVEAARVVEQYDALAHVWSTYESRLDPSEEPFARGINSIQLVNDGTRWWVLSVTWEQESPAAPIPAEYLPEGE